MEYIAHLQKDKRLSKKLGDQIHVLKFHKNIPLRLMAAIMGQQLSTKVAAVIYNRFLELYKGKEPSPQQVLNTSHDTLRSIGLSNAKAQYVKNVAEFCITHKVTDRKLLKKSDEEVITLLTQIKGVGKWTVEMLLMFSLGREDVFSVDDYGLQQAMIQLYKLDNTDKKKLREELLKLASKWSPYKTYACLHLWEWKDNVPG